MENDRPLLPEMLVPVRAMPHRAGVPVGEPNDGRPVCAGRCPSNPRGLGPSWAYYNYGGDEWNSMRGGLLEAARGAIRAMKENRAMTDQDRLNAIVRDITTRQVTMYAGRPSTPGELMAREIVRLRASVDALTGALRDARAEFEGMVTTEQANTVNGETNMWDWLDELQKALIKSRKIVASRPPEHAVRMIETLAREVLIVNEESESPKTNPIRRWRHRESGTVYTEICRGTLHVETTTPKNLDCLVVYQTPKGQIWMRAKEEFLDGDFEEITSDLADVERDRKKILEEYSRDCS